MSARYRFRDDPALSRTLQWCQACREACLTSILHCTERGEPFATPRHLQLLRGCAEICQTTMNFIVRESDLTPVVANACAVICIRCAESCEVFEDDTLHGCAEACRRCADALAQR